MTFNDFLIQNIFQIATIIFLLGGVIWSARNLSNKVDENIRKTEVLSERIQNKITELDIRLARQEEKTSILDEIRGQINDIWKHLMRSNPNVDKRE